MTSAITWHLSAGEIENVWLPPHATDAEAGLTEPPAPAVAVIANGPKVEDVTAMVWLA